MADSATTAGAVVAIVLIFVLPGALLLRSGLRARRRTAHTPWSPPAAWSDRPLTAESELWGGPFDAVEPPPRQGTPRVVIASFLLGLGALGLVGAAAHAVTSPPAEQTVVVMPASLLGLPRDDSDLSEDRANLVRALGRGMDQVEFGFYGPSPGELLVVAARGEVGPLPRAMDEFERGLSAQRSQLLKDGTDVGPGALGGLGRCWLADELGAAICVVFNDSSVVMTFDYKATSIDEAAQRARSVRDAVLEVR